MHIQYTQYAHIAQCTCSIHRKKKVREFPVPSRDVTTKLSMGGNNDVITELFLPSGSLVSDIPAGDGKLVNLFLRCIGAGGHSKIFFNSKLQCERKIFLSSAWTVGTSDFDAQMSGIKIVIASVLDFLVHKKYTLTLL